MAESIRCSCPRCATRLTVKQAGTAGKRIKCPKCLKPFVIEEMADEDEETDRTARRSLPRDHDEVERESPKKRRMRRDDDDPDDGYGLETEEAPKEVAPRIRTKVRKKARREEDVPVRLPWRLLSGVVGAAFGALGGFLGLLVGDLRGDVLGFAIGGAVAGAILGGPLGVVYGLSKGKTGAALLTGPLVGLFVVGLAGAGIGALAKEKGGFSSSVWLIAWPVIGTMFGIFLEVIFDEPPQYRMRAINEEDDRPASGKQGRRSRKKGRVIGLVPLLILGPPMVVSLVLSPLFPWAAMTAVSTGLWAGILGFVMSYRLFKKKGLDDEMDDAMHDRSFLETFGIAAVIGGIVAERAHRGNNPAPAPAVVQQPNPGPGVVEQPKPQPGQRPEDNAPAVPRLTGDRQIDVLLAQLGDEKQPINRMAAANTFGRMQPNEHRAVVAEKLAEVVVGANEFGRGEAARALIIWATPKQIPTLIRGLRNAGVRNAMGKSLRTVGSAAENDVLQLLGDQDIGIRREAVEILKDIGTRQSLPALQDLIDRNDFFTRQPAREAIAAIQARAGT